MHISVNEQKIKETANFYKGEGSIELRAAIGFGGAPVQKNSNVMTAMRMTIPVGSSVGTHIHEGAEELYVVLSGQGLHTTEGEEYEINPGDVIHTMSGLQHSVTTVGDEDLVLQASLIKKQ